MYLTIILSVEAWISGLSAAYNDVAIHHEKETLAAGVAIKGAALPRIRQAPVFSLSTSDTGMHALVNFDSEFLKSLSIAALSSLTAVAPLNTTKSKAALRDEGLSQITLKHNVYI